jgi:hypothetical protein
MAQLSGKAEAAGQSELRQRLQELDREIETLTDDLLGEVLKQVGIEEASLVFD